MISSKLAVRHVERALAGVVLVAGVSFVVVLLLADRQSFLTDVKQGAFAPEFVTAALATAGWLLLRRARHASTALRQPTARDRALLLGPSASRCSGTPTPRASDDTEEALAMGALLAAHEILAHGSPFDSADDSD